jgi:hypothetical protein
MAGANAAVDNALARTDRTAHRRLMSMAQLFPSWRGGLAWEARAAELAEQYPARLAFAAIDERMRHERGHGYHLAPAVAAVLDEYAEEERRALIYALLLWQMVRFPRRFARSGLPEEFALHYADSFHRIMDGIADRSFPCDPRSDLVQKDLALTRLVLIPAVAQLLYPRSGVPLKPLLRWGPRSWRYVWRRCGGRSPFVEIHTHDPMAGAYFNAEGWEQCYRLTALLMRALPELRGLVGFSWFYDPALEGLSPRLGYLRHSPVSQGARLMPMGADEDSARLATATSPSRRAAYEAGSYRPRRYALIWSRADLLEHYR